MVKRRSSKKPRPVIGWREWIVLPELAPDAVKVKIDTGARTSALHAFDLRVDRSAAVPVATFELHPKQRSRDGATRVRAEVLGHRQVRSSSGHSERRPVIATTVRLGDHEWPVELTLTTRDEMGFRMLLGRSAVRGRFVVDPGRSFLLSSNARQTRSTPSR